MASIFTKIINGEIPSYKIYEDEKFFAFLDINPLKEGHTLLIPKKEIDYIFDMEPYLLSEIMIISKKIASALKKSIECERIGVAVIGLEVPHAHIHLVPINEVGDINFKKERIKLSEKQFFEIAEKIKSNLE